MAEIGERQHFLITGRAVEVAFEASLCKNVGLEKRVRNLFRTPIAKAAHTEKYVGSIAPDMLRTLPGVCLMAELEKYSTRLKLERVFTHAEAITEVLTGQPFAPISQNSSRPPEIHARVGMAFAFLAGGLTPCLSPR